MHIIRFVQNEFAVVLQLQMWVYVVLKETPSPYHLLEFQLLEGVLASLCSPDRKAPLASLLVEHPSNKDLLSNTSQTEATERKPLFTKTTPLWAITSISRSTMRWVNWRECLCNDELALQSAAVGAEPLATPYVGSGVGIYSTAARLTNSLLVLC